MACLEPLRAYPPVSLLLFSWVTFLLADLLLKVHTFSHAGRASGRWAYVRYPRRPMGPFHPLHKLALFVVTRSGKLKLLYQNQESKWGDMVIELQNTGYTDDVLTHASMTPVDGKIYAR